MYMSLGDFDVYLNVMCEDDSALIAEGKTSDTTGPKTESVIAKPVSCYFDLYTEAEQLQHPHNG